MKRFRFYQLQFVSYWVNVGQKDHLANLQEFYRTEVKIAIYHASMAIKANTRNHPILKAIHVFVFGNV